MKKSIQAQRQINPAKLGGGGFGMPNNPRVPMRNNATAPNNGSRPIANFTNPALNAGMNGIGTRPTPTQPNISFPGQEYAFNTIGEFVSTNNLPRPESCVITVNSAAGAGAATIPVFLFNQDLAVAFNVTDNGSGAGSITYVYNDGAAGVVLSWLLAQDRAGMGAICFGLSLLYTVISTGAGNPNAIGTGNPQFLQRTAYNNSMPTNFASTMNQTRKDFNTAIEVYTCRANIGRWTQFGVTVAPDNSVQGTFNFQPEFAV